MITKGDLLFRSNGFCIFATQDSDVAVMEWERPGVCDLAHAIHLVLQHHALNTAFLDRLGQHGLVVRRADRLDLVVEVSSGPRATSIRWLKASDGRDIPEGELTAIPGVKPSRIDMMKDSAVHAARSLRAHLHSERLLLRLRFGVTDEGDCLMEIPNPLDCNLGSHDYTRLTAQLGGTAT